MVKSHLKLACGGRCALSEPTYYRELLLIASSLAKETGRVLLPSWRSSFTDDGIDLVDPDLHGFICLAIVPDVETTAEVYHLIKAALLRRQADFIGDKLSPELEILLRCGVVVQDADMLRSTLEISRRLYLPACLIASLLRRAITQFFDEGVQILLEFGASADRGLFTDFYDRPLARATNLFVSYDFERGAETALIHQANVTQLDRSAVINEKVRSLTQITGSLINHGADLLGRILDASTGDIALHRVAWIAIRSPEAARLIINATPAAGLSNSSGVLMAFDSPMYSPMAVSLHVAARLYRTVRREAANILLYAVLPLLRAGAASGPDLMRESEFLRSFSTFLRSSPDDDRLSIEIWGRPEMSTVYLLETRQKSSLDVERLLKTVSNGPAWRNSSEEEVSAVRKFINMIRAHFPRSLQAICRLNILRHLPLGVKARQDAIEALQFPLFVTNFLKFSDLDR